MVGSYGDIPGSWIRIDISDPKERIDSFLETYRKEKQQYFELPFLSHYLKVVSASQTPTVTATYEMVNDREFCNRNSKMQGGAVAMVLDSCNAMTIVAASRKGFWDIIGLTRALNIAYLRPIEVDAELVIECKILQIGNRLATISGKMKDKSTGKLLAVAEQTQASIVDSAPEPGTKL